MVYGDSFSVSSVSATHPILHKYQRRKTSSVGICAQSISLKRDMRSLSLRMFRSCLLCNPLRSLVPGAPEPARAALSSGENRNLIGVGRCVAFDDELSNTITCVHDKRGVT